MFARSCRCSYFLFLSDAHFKSCSLSAAHLLDINISLLFFPPSRLRQSNNQQSMSYFFIPSGSCYQMFTCFEMSTVGFQIIPSRWKKKYIKSCRFARNVFFIIIIILKGDTLFSGCSASSACIGVQSLPF